MAKILPDKIERNDSRRNGEYLIYDLFSQEKIKGTVLYSLFQKNHLHKLIGEIDFLYICERGLICFEIKGGQAIYRKNGVWYSENKRKVENTIHNPFEQAKDCQYALKRYLKDTYGIGSVQSHYCIGYAVIFPECVFTGSGNDLVTEVMYDARNNLDDFPDFLSRVFDYWESLEYNRHGYKPEKLNTQQINQVVNLLRGDFNVVPSMNLELQHASQKMLQLTEEQYNALDITESNDRVIVQGGAGTGKSLLALEKVRRCAAKEKRVLYICFNRNMSKYAASSLKDQNGEFINISTYHALLMTLLSDYNLYNLDTKGISKLFLDKKSKYEKYDYIVVDEGQDLMSTEVIDVLNLLLVNGISKGKWTVFLDPNQNIFHYSDEYDFALDYLKEISSPTIYNLNKNCRNTEQIARRTAALTLVPPAKYLNIPGPKVVAKSYTDGKDMIRLVKKELAALLAGGENIKEVVFLSKYKLQNSDLNSQTSFCNYTLIAKKDIADFGKNCLNYFTIQSFKGLESKIVFLVDVKGFGDDENRFLNYVAMSRARILLYIFYDVSCEEDYHETLDKGRELL